VVERAGLPAALFRIHLGGFEKEEANDNAEARQDCGANLALEP
jgi:hypothetical protein